MRRRRRRDRYDRGRRLEPSPWGGFYPPVPWGGGVVYGLEGGGPAPFEPIGYHPYGDDYRYTLRRHPEESPTYGRRGDPAIRRWGHEHGYEEEWPVGYGRRRRRPRAGPRRHGAPRRRR